VAHHTAPEPVMDDNELELIAQLSFIRSDLEQFVLAVLGLMDPQFRAVTWPADETDLGRHLVMLGRSLQWHAGGRATPVGGERMGPSDGRSPIPLFFATNEDHDTCEGGEGNGDHARGDG
jgi:hypothetical protein